MPELITHHARIDAILEEWRDALGPDFAAYRGHVYRMFNFCLPLTRGDADEDTLAIAAAFHDLGIWADRTFDYLEPSVDRAVTYLHREAPSVSADAVSRMIRWHHKITPCAADLGAAVEAFRLADRVDLLLGVVRSGLPRAFVRDVRRAFPNAGFHWRLVQLSCAWGIRHPLRPLPMFRW